MSDLQQSSKLKEGSWLVLKFEQEVPNLVIRCLVTLVSVLFIGLIISSPFITLKQKVRVEGTVVAELGVRSIVAISTGTFRWSVEENADVKEGDLIGLIEIRGVPTQKIHTTIENVAQIEKQLDEDKIFASIRSGKTPESIQILQMTVAEPSWTHVEPEISFPINDILSRFDQYTNQIQKLQKAKQAELEPLQGSLKAINAKISRLKKMRSNRDIAFFVDGIEDERRKLTNQIAQVENSYNSKRQESEQGIRQSVKKGLVEMQMASGRAEVRAPIAGRLYRRVVPSKSQVQERSIVGEMLPSGSRVVAELRVRPNDQPRLKVDQLSYMKLDAYPYHEFGLFKGTILDVKPVADSNGKYIAVSTIDPTDRVAIQSLPIGSKVNADIVVGEKSVLRLGIEKFTGEWL